MDSNVTLPLSKRATTIALLRNRIAADKAELAPLVQEETDEAIANADAEALCFRYAVSRHFVLAALGLVLLGLLLMSFPIERGLPTILISLIFVLAVICVCIYWSHPHARRGACRCGNKDTVQ